MTLKLLDNHLTGESLNQQSALEFQGTGRGKGERERAGGEEVKGVKKKKKKKKNNALDWLTYSVQPWIASLAFLGSFYHHISPPPAPTLPILS